MLFASRLSGRATLGLIAALLFTQSCSCKPPPAQTEDGGSQLMPQCTTDTDCALGESCIESMCVVPMSQMDGATGCTDDSECPMGERCLRSAGVCVPDTTMNDAGMEEQDSGVLAECLEGETQTCGTSKLGECRLGVQTCEVINGALRFGACVGAIDPVTELCNGLDDDCDGVVDDGFTTATCGVGACTRTVETCVGGTTLTCTPNMGSAEICDGIDNDCDSMTDEGIADLGCGVGQCRRIVAACVSGAIQTCTAGMPVTETCNGLDDDCDGNVDNGLGQTSCGLGQCRRTVDNCTMGMPQTCMPGPMATESCNMLDDDCDGLIDETCACNNGATQSCYTGTPGTQGVGVCRAGTQTCVNNQWDACVGQNTGTTETCNNADDNCNGMTDEGLGQTSCGTGACARTVQNCAAGVTQTCSPGPMGTETCNNIDDDCNGMVDDGLGTTSCGVGACARTVNVCVSGVTQTCTAGSPTTELCNGIDDNCNMLTDETFPGSGGACTTGQQGLCAAGTTRCTSGAVTCQQTNSPTAEVCSNGLDENCNGINDDPMACGCNTMIDRDFDGANECVDCNDLDGTIRPSATETCNGKDDNCNGTRDEGFDVDMDTFTTCGTLPMGGVDTTRRDCNDTNAFVFPLKMTDCGNAATPATPNSVDDNCNGYTDETCACTTTDRDGDGVTQCAGDCNDNDATVSPTRPEVCDGKDNDCNRRTVDNCGVSEPCGARSMGTWQRFATGTDQCRPDLICTSNVSTGELTCGSFCNQTTGTGLNDSCQANEGCYRNLIDSDNLHLCSVLTVGTKTPGQACSLSTECRSGDCATFGAAKYCSDKCTHEAGCNNVTTCTVRKDPLFAQGAMPIGYYLWSACQPDTTITATKTLGQTCSGAECRTGVDGCFNGKCTEPCCSNADCPGGYACTIAGPKSATGYASGGLSIVSVMPACVASTAVRVSGAACATNADCKSGLCEKATNICIDVCCNDSSCPNGTTCEPVSLKLSSTEQTTIRACLFAPYPTLIERK